MIINTIKNFIKGAFDYYNPSAGDGATGAISALPEITKFYKKKKGRR
ncbi:MAG: hypothetical protein ACOC85_04710 [Thermoplasmatota archaeon]